MLQRDALSVPDHVPQGVDDVAKHIVAVGKADQSLHIGEVVVQNVAADLGAAVLHTVVVPAPGGFRAVVEGADDEVQPGPVQNVPRGLRTDVGAAQLQPQAQDEIGVGKKFCLVELGKAGLPVEGELSITLQAQKVAVVGNAQLPQPGSRGRRRHIVDGGLTVGGDKGVGVVVGEEHKIPP